MPVMARVTYVASRVRESIRPLHVRTRDKRWFVADGMAASGANGFPDFKQEFLATSQSRCSSIKSDRSRTPCQKCKTWTSQAARPRMQKRLPSAQANRVVLSLDQNHLRTKHYYGTGPDAAKIQIRNVVASNFMVAILRQQLRLPGTRHKISKLRSVHPIEKVPLHPLLTGTDL